MTIAIKDENFSGSIIHEINLDFQQENVTVRDIITQRVIQEVENYNQTTKPKKLLFFYFKIFLMSRYFELN